MASVSGAQQFVEEMALRGGGPVIYAELPGAGHNFDLFASLRHNAVATAALEFVEAVRSRA